jgi:multicomponent Na+:H+ antiporter subunit B
VSAATRRSVVLVALAGIAALLVAAVVGLPPAADPLARFYLAHAVEQRQATNVVMAITFDYRGIDTLGEELILFAASSGVALLLRESRRAGRRGRPPEAEPVEALAAAGVLGAPALVVLGLWLVLHGHVSPGGGFQGGVVLAAGALVSLLTGHYGGFRTVTPEPMLDAAESVGVAGYAVVGLLGLASGAGFLANVLPLGQAGSLVSSGTIATLDLLVGLAVPAAFVLLATELVEEAIAAGAQR